jgi:hypothetical protein
VSVLLGNGDGTFAGKVGYQAGTVPASVALGDLNGDGRIDIAVANSDESDSTVSVLLGIGDGTFVAKTDYGAGGWPNSVVVGDLNGDGVADLATAIVTVTEDVPTTYSVDVGLGQRGGTLASFTKYPTAGFARVIAISDLNGDGRPDLALAKETSVGVMLGRGDGTFEKLVASPVTAKITTLSFGVGDLNGDGTPDLALATGAIGSCADKINVLLGKGDGTFATR